MVVFMVVLIYGDHKIGDNPLFYAFVYLDNLKVKCGTFENSVGKMRLLFEGITSKKAGMKNVLLFEGGYYFRAATNRIKAVFYIIATDNRVLN